MTVQVAFPPLAEGTTQDTLDAIVQLEAATLLVEAKGRDPTMRTLLREEMAAREWRVRDLAERLNVRFGVVSRWVTDDEAKRVVPAPLMCFRIAKTFNLDPVHVFRRAGYWPLEDLPRHPHHEEIEGLLRLLARIMRRVPEDEWTMALVVARVQLDSLQALINRLAEDL